MFARWAKKSLVTDNSLLDAAIEIAAGKIDAYYGGSLYKKRIANKGRGKSGSTRVLLCFEVNARLVFLYGFEKAERDNIQAREKLALQILTRKILKLNDIEIEQKLREGSLVEVIDEQNI